MKIASSSPIEEFKKILTLQLEAYLNEDQQRYDELERRLNLLQDQL